MPHTTMAEVLAVIEPGETVTYAELLERLKDAGAHPSAMMLLEPFRANPYHHRLPIAVWHEPVWDEEVEGGWAPGRMMISRRPG